MSDLMTDEEQILWFLYEFENAEDEQLEFCELEIYGEDEQGREGTCTISVQEIARKSADFIKKLISERDAALAQNAELVAQVEATKSAYQNLCGAISDMDDCESDTDEMETAIGAVFHAMRNGYNSFYATPAYCLRDIQTEAGRAGYYQGFKDALVIEPPLPPSTGTSATIDVFAYRVEQASRYAANQYAERVKAGE